MAANTYLREFTQGGTWVRLADAPLVCHVTLVAVAVGPPLGEEYSPLLRCSGGAEVHVPMDVPIEFDGVDLYGFEILIVNPEHHLLVFAQSR